MANESKIRVLDEQPVLGDDGSILFIRIYAGPAGATKPTTGLANGSMYIYTDTTPGTVAWYDEVTGTWSDEGE